MQRYTEYELRSMDITTLRAICKELKIKAASLDLYDNKDAMVQRIYKYRGTFSDKYITEWDDEKILRLQKAIEEKGEARRDKVEVPAYFKIYKGIDSLNERGFEHKVYTEADIDMTSAVVVDMAGRIQAVVNVARGLARNSYLLTLNERMLNKTIKPDIYRNFKIIFFLGDFDKIRNIYDNDMDVIPRFSYVARDIHEVMIHEVDITEDVLVIDYGTSYTTAGTYVDNKVKSVWFYTNEKCDHDEEKSARYAECKECGRCALCPSAIAVQECTGDKISLLFGHEAKDRVPMSRNSIFFDTKRWVNEYTEDIEVKDLAGNTAIMKRSELIRRFMEYIIHTAEQQNKVRYKNICFTSPVKQKATSLRMYRDILREYSVQDRDAVDEAIAVVYDSITQQVKNLEYKDGDNLRVLLIDCGGSTSDMVECSYEITRNYGIEGSHATGQQHKGTKISMDVGYANGDTNFGGNNLTYRIMQYIKIKLAEFYQRVEPVSIDRLLNVSYGEIYDYVDTVGVLSTYEGFEKAYKKAGAILPSDYDNYRNDSEDVYFRVRANFYFLWDLAERIKVDLYSSSSEYEFSFTRLKSIKGLYMVSVINEKGNWVTHGECPPIRILRDEISLLLKPEIYSLIKKFILPYYEKDETMSEIHIKLSGQTTKIDIFRDVLKEYVAGHKTRAPFEHGYIKKLKCIRGAVAYHGAKVIGRIRTDITYESPIIPYHLSVETFNEEVEKYLVSQGDLLSSIYSWIDRPIGTRIIEFTLKSHDKDILQTISRRFDSDQFKPTNEGELMKNNPWLKDQKEIDQITDGDVRFFVYSTDESWGFKYFGVARIGGRFSCGEEEYVPFESTEWETNFFDGKR